MLMTQSQSNVKTVTAAGRQQHIWCVQEQVQQWRAAGKEPYAYSFQRTHLAAQLQAEHKDLPAGEVPFSA